jgi:hypothetical protein
VKKIGLGETPLNISIEGCDKLPCNMVRGTKVVGGMDFKYGKSFYNKTPSKKKKKIIEKLQIL